MSVLEDVWPAASIAMHTPRLAMRPPADEEIAWLAANSRGRILAPEQAGFLGPWVQIPEGEYQQQFIQHYWQVKADMTPNEWTLNFFLYLDSGLGEEPHAIGNCSLSAADWSDNRSVETGSWIFQTHQGNGLGTELRCGLLALAQTLGANWATTSARTANAPSRGVCHKLGYSENGRDLVSGEEMVYYRLDLTTWQSPLPITVTGADQFRAWISDPPPPYQYDTIDV